MTESGTEDTGIGGDAGIGWLPAPAEELFGPDARAEESYGLLTVDVPPTAWLAALRTARDTLTCTYFDWLSAVDEPSTAPDPGAAPEAGFRVAAHVVALSPVRRLLVRTTVPHATPVLPSAVDVYAGAAWHERETHEMFGVRFEGHPGLDHLLLPEGFEGHPLRKDFVLAARVAKAWPGAKEPGESEHGGPKRRQMLPPGVPDPNEWGPLKGQLPPARAAGARAAGARAAGDRPVRRARTASEGSASQTPAAAAAAGAASQTPPAEGAPTEAPPTAPRRARSASQGSASQRPQSPPPEATGPGTPEATEATEATEVTGTAGTAGPGTPEAAADDAARKPPQSPPAKPRGADAPWHHARPAFDEPDPKNAEPAPAPETRDAAPAESPSSDSEAPAERSPADPTPENATPEDPAGGSQ